MIQSEPLIAVICFFVIVLLPPAIIWIIDYCLCEKKKALIKQLPDRDLPIAAKDFIGLLMLLDKRDMFTSADTEIVYRQKDEVTGIPMDEARRMIEAQREAERQAFAEQQRIEEVRRLAAEEAKRELIKQIGGLIPIKEGRMIRCPNCNTLQRPERTHCWNCGGEFVP